MENAAELSDLCSSASSDSIGSVIYVQQRCNDCSDNIADASTPKESTTCRAETWPAGQYGANTNNNGGSVAREQTATAGTAAMKDRGAGRPSSLVLRRVVGGSECSCSSTDSDDDEEAAMRREEEEQEARRQQLETSSSSSDENITYAGLLLVQKT